MEDNTAFKLTPELAELLATQPLSHLRELYGDEFLLLVRFVQGRERRELPPPTQAELDIIGRWYAQVKADEALAGLTIKGMAYIDIDDKGGLVWQMTSEGNDQLQR